MKIKKKDQINVEYKVRMSQIPILVAALKEIHNTSGNVCEEYDLCDHDSCRSSSSAWIIADQVLKFLKIDPKIKE